MKQISTIQILASLTVFMFGILVLLFQISFGVIQCAINADWNGLLNSIIKYDWNIYVHALLCLALSLCIVLGRTKLVAVPFAGFVILNVYNLLSGISVSEVVLLVLNSLMLAVALLNIKSPKAVFIPLMLYLVVFTADLLSCILFKRVDVTTVISDMFGTIAYCFCFVFFMRKDSVYTETFADGYINMFVHCLLMLYTFGMWNFFWIYRITKYLNTFSDENKQIPLLEFFLCMIPFYPIYWGNIVSRKIDKLCFKRNINIKISIICTILMTVVIFLPPLIMQNTLNKILES